ncbi:MAG: hypothetical protein VST71_07625 [Nitrospirota bacterium]|nr:hypothetical protein [Nitrospirota bacterium]
MFRPLPMVLRVILSLMIVAASVSPTYADEVTDTIKDALQEYRSGKYKAATEDLEYASQLIMQKRAERLQSFLPPPPPGWTAEDAASRAIGSAVAGVKVGIYASRQYHKGSGTVTVTISTDLPMLQIQMMFNPLLGVSEKGRLKRIKGQKAVIEYNPEEKRGKISVLAANSFLITVEGKGVSKGIIEDYAKRIDYKGLTTLP